MTDVNHNPLSIDLTKPTSVQSCFVDVCFLMDSSSSIGDESGAWEKEGAFVTSMVASIATSSNPTTGIIVNMFSGDVVTIADYKTKQEIAGDPTYAARVRNAQLLNDGTDMGAGINKCKVRL